MTATIFQCEKCTVTGLVKHRNDADVYTVLQMIRDKHKEKSPKCEFDDMKVRVISTVEDPD